MFSKAETASGSAALMAASAGALLLCASQNWGCSAGFSRDPDKAQVKAAANTECYGCHESYQDEMLSQSHRKAGVGCAECHGASKAHMSHPKGLVPPDVMIDADLMPVFCATCHRTHDAPAVKVIAQYRKRCAGKTNPEEIACTDCHGAHRLKARTVRWDRKTRELIPAEKKP